MAVSDDTGKGKELVMGFQSYADDEGEGDRRGRGGKGGAAGRGGDRLAKEGGRRQTAKKALAKTELDFPTL